MTEQLDLLPSARPSQLALPLRVECADRHPISSTSNREALRLVEAWPAWPSHACLICGPTGSGKTYLASNWADLASARKVGAEELRAPDLGNCEARAIWIDNADIALGGERRGAAERGLFHLLNRVRAAGGHLLLTARRPVDRWNVALPDLASRLRSATRVALDMPDAALMSMVAMKLLAERQISAERGLVDAITMRTERSLTALDAAIDRLDRAALRDNVRLDGRLVAKVLDAP